MDMAAAFRIRFPIADIRATQAPRQVPPGTRAPLSPERNAQSCSAQRARPYLAHPRGDFLASGQFLYSGILAGPTRVTDADALDAEPLNSPHTVGRSLGVSIISFPDFMNVALG
jgi:hypothetical protein